MPWLGRSAAACTAPAVPLPGVVSERMRRFARMNSFKKEARRVGAGQGRGWMGWMGGMGGLQATGRERHMAHGVGANKEAVRVGAGCVVRSSALVCVESCPLIPTGQVVNCDVLFGLPTHSPLEKRVPPTHMPQTCLPPSSSVVWWS